MPEVAFQAPKVDSEAGAVAKSKFLRTGTLLVSWESSKQRAHRAILAVESVVCLHRHLRPRASQQLIQMLEESVC